MPCFSSSCVASFATKMRPDTIAVFLCLLLVTLGIGHTIVSSGVVVKVIECLSDVFDFLYWELDYLYWNLCYEYSNNGIPTYLRVFAFLMVCAFTPRVLAEFLLWLGIISEVPQNNAQELAEKGESRNTKKPTIPIIAPVTPVPLSPAPPILVPPSYPPPFQFPFKNFRGTGESFAHLDRNDPMQYPIYRLPETWGKSRCADHEWMATSTQMPAVYRSTEGDKVVTQATTSKLEGIQRIAKSTTNDMKQDVVATPAHKVVELPLQTAPAPTPTQSAYTSAPSYEPRTTTTFVHPPAHSSPEALGTIYNSLQIANSARMTIEHHARRAPALQNAMRAFLLAADAKTECMSSANQILSLISSAENDLKFYFKDVMTVEQSSGLCWNTSITEFWMYLVPAGLYIQRHWSPELITFLELFRGFANYLGLEDRIQQLDCTEPLPSPHAPQYMVQPTQTPYQNPPQVAQIPSWSVLQQNVAPVIASPLPPYPPKAQQCLPQPTPSSTQVPPAPKMDTQSVPLTFNATIQAPLNHVVQASQTTSTTSAPLQQQSVQQPQVTQGAPPLLDFKDDTWLKMPDEELKELTWESFENASLDIWSFDSLELAQLPGEHPEFIMAQYVKGELEKVAPHLKRAAVVLRLQGGKCPWPDWNDLPMVPLMGRTYACLLKAQEMTEICQEIAVWDSQDEWYQACLYLHKYVIKQAGILRWLRRRYGNSKTRPLTELWDEMKQEWIPDIE